MRKRQRGPRPVSDEPLSAGRVEYLEQARERVRNRRIRRTALIVVALTLVVLFTTGIVGSSVAMAKDWADTARILLFPGTGWPQQTGVMEAVSYTHLRAHETDSYLVCRLLLEKKKPITFYDYCIHFHMMKIQIDSIP